MLPNPIQHQEGANIKLSTVRTVRFVKPLLHFLPKSPYPKKLPQMFASLGNIPYICTVIVN